MGLAMKKRKGGFHGNRYCDVKNGEKQREQRKSKYSIQFLSRERLILSVLSVLGYPTGVIKA